MKWRVVLTVCFVLTLFAGFAYLYVNAFVRKHQHGVILFVVNGLDLNTLDLARQQAGHPLQQDLDDPGIGDARRRVADRSSMLNLDSFWNVALLNVQAAGQPVPDEGVDATALACGQRVANGFVGINSRNEVLHSLIALARDTKRATGLVTTGSLVDPTSVAFYSTIKGTPDPYRNAAELIDSRIDIILGGGEQYFVPANAANELGRRDGHNLLDEAQGRDRGYKLLRARDDLDNLSTWTTDKVFGVFASDQFYFSSLQPEKRRQPSLAEMTRAAISILNYKIDGYFLVVEDNLVANAAKQNFGKLAVNEAAAVDQAIQSAVEYAGPDALVIVTNSYSLGALGNFPDASEANSLNAPALPEFNPKVAQIVLMPFAAPAPVWVAGPGGPLLLPAQEAWLRQRYDSGSFSTNAPGLLQPQPALRFQTAASPLAEPAWMASRGEGSSQLRGFFNNTDVFDIIAEQF
jgi:alkaline phosphatase